VFPETLFINRANHSQQLGYVLMGTKMAAPLEDAATGCKIFSLEKIFLKTKPEQINLDS